MTKTRENNIKKYILGSIFIILIYVVLTNINTIIYILQAAIVVVMFIVLLWIINFFGKINQKGY